MKFDKKLKSGDGEVYPFSEDFNDNGYFYQISVIYDGREAVISIISAGVDILFEDGEFLDAKLKPECLFPNQTRLTKDDLIKILSIVDRPDHKFDVYSKEKMEKIYEQYLKETKKTNNSE